jgi:hypothetical protein
MPFYKNAGMTPAQSCWFALRTEGNLLRRILPVRLRDQDKPLSLFARTAHFLLFLKI